MRRRRRRRRIALAALAGAAALPLILVLAFPLSLPLVAGAWEHAPGELDALSPGARAVLERALDGLDERTLDHHVHVAGLGTGGSGCSVNPAMLSRWNPLRHARFLVYLHASGVRDRERADQEYVERLIDLAEHSPAPGRLALLAFDRHHRPDGSVDAERTELHVPNEWVWEIAARRPDLFVPVASIHPYRADAVQELERWANRGVRLVKWLPSAMGMDPASPLCDPFYAAAARHDVAILTHAGRELAVHAEELQELGNPLRLRRALDAGVQVIVAHCASLGTDVDLDDPDRPRIPSFELFLRLMGEPRYVGRLWGEVSALTLVNRVGDPLRVLLRREDLHARLVNGSDYPLPAIQVMVHLRPLVRGGFLTADEASALREIYDHDPLLFDLVLKRSLRSPDTGRGFPPSVFAPPPGRILDAREGPPSDR